MSTPRVIKGAAFLAMDGRRTVRHGEILVEDGGIAAIGGVGAPSGAIVTESRGVLIPGFVQAHLHMADSLLDRHFVPEPSTAGFELVQRARRRRRRAPDAVATAVGAGFARGIAKGVTTFAAVQDGLPVLDAAEAFGARAVIAVAAASTDPRPALDLLDAALTKEELRRTITPALWLGAAEWASKRRLTEATKIATTRRIPLLAHAGTIPGDGSAIRRLDRARALGPHLVLCHACGDALADPGHVAALAEAGASVILTPSHDLILGAQPPPIDALLDAEVTVGLGSDSGATRVELDPLREARLLVGQLRGREDAASLALEIATRGGASALELASGTLAVGLRADLVALDLPVTESDSHESLASRILDGGASRIRTVWIQGEVAGNDRGPVRAQGPSDATTEAIQLAEQAAVADETQELGYWWARARAALGR